MSIKNPLFTMTIDLTTYRADALKDTLDRIRALVHGHDQTGADEIKAKIKVVSDSEEAIEEIRNQLEIYLRHNKTLIDGKVNRQEPLIRPRDETDTPMDAIEGFAQKYGATVEFVSSDREPR